MPSNARTHDDIARVWDILEKTGVGMLTTQFSGGLRARPLEARPDREAGAIFFVTDVRGHKDDEIAARPEVCFVVIDPKDKAYLSITGRASISRDRASAAAIWKKPDDVWWQGGPDDPNVRVLTLEPVTAELWDGPSSSLVAAYEFAKARHHGRKADCSARTARRPWPCVESSSALAGFLFFIFVRPRRMRIVASAKLLPACRHNSRLLYFCLLTAVESISGTRCAAGCGPNLRGRWRKNRSRQ